MIQPCYGRYNPRLIFKMLCYTNQERDTYESLEDQRKVYEGTMEPKTATQIHLSRITQAFYYLKSRRNKLTMFQMKKAYRMLAVEERPLCERKLEVLVEEMNQECSDVMDFIIQIFTTIIVQRVFHQYSREMAILLCNVSLLKKRYSPILFYVNDNI